MKCLVSFSGKVWTGISSRPRECKLFLKETVNIFDLGSQESIKDIMQASI